MMMMMMMEDPNRRKQMYSMESVSSYDAYSPR